MKSIYISVCTLLAAGIMTAQAQVSPDEVRIYINPGHGSWTANDRPCQVIGKPAYTATGTDTTGFFETNTNLYKGFGMLEEFIKMGIPFDRTLNQTGERWEIGAARDLSQNLVMSRVKNGPYATVNNSSTPNANAYNRSLYEICEEVEANNFDAFISIHSNATSTDITTTNYHLLEYRGEDGEDGVLVDGSWEMCQAVAKVSFANTHMNWSESAPYIRGDISFNHGSSTNGLGYTGYLGVLKHGCPGFLVEGYFHTYTPGRHRAMNWDVDIMEGVCYARGFADYFEIGRAATGDIYGIVRDKHLKLKSHLYLGRGKDQYKPVNGCKVVLCRDGVKVAEYTTDGFYNGAFVFRDLEPGKYLMSFSHPDYKDIDGYEIEVVGGDCVYPAIDVQARTWITLDDLTDTYPDQLDGDGAYGACDRYGFVKSYSDLAEARLEGSEVVRTLVRERNMYVLALTGGNPVVVLYDLKAKKAVKTMDLGDAGNVTDIALSGEGALLAANDRGDVYVVDDVAGPRLLASFGIPVCTMACRGTLADGAIAVADASGMAKGITVSDGVASDALTYQLPDVSGKRLIAAPAGQGFWAVEAGTSAFRYAGHAYLTSVSADGVSLTDVTDGQERPRAVTVTGAALDKLDVPAASCSWIEVTRDAESNAITAAAIEINIVRDGKITRMTTAGAEQASYRSAYAYDLQAKVADGLVDLSYRTSSPAAVSATLILTPAAGGEDIRLPLPSPVDGLNTAEVETGALGDGDYRWSVELVSADVPVSAVSMIPNPAGNTKATRGGVAWMDDTECPSFGKLVVTNGNAQGIDVYNADMTRQNTVRYMPEGNRWDKNNASSPYRVAVLDGKAVICDLSNKGSGYWEFDPENPETVRDMMEGEIDSRGAHSVGGVIIGGGSSALAFTGNGDERRMFTFADDYPEGNADYMVLLRYPVGTAKSWAMKPDMTFGSVSGAAASLMSVKNVEIVATDKGLFLSQNRRLGNNTQTTPVLAFVDYDGNVRYNSYDGNAYDLNGGGGGIAISRDGSVMAISEAKSGIGIWNLGWQGSVPVLTKRYLIPGSEGDDEIPQMTFDIAGNLYAYHRDKAGLRVYSIRGESPTAVTAAPASQLLRLSAGVADITADAAEGPVRYYNMQGVEMPAGAALAPGLYIRKSGKQAVKVVIR